MVSAGTQGDHVFEVPDGYKLKVMQGNQGLLYFPLAVCYDIYQHRLFISRDKYIN